MRTIGLGLLLIAFSVSAGAHDPDAPFADWFKSLKEPDHPSVSCCGTADQHYVDEYHEMIDGGFIVMVDGDWIDVPAEKVDWTSVNPTGRGVIFLSDPELGNDRFVYCFVPGLGM